MTPRWIRLSLAIFSLLLSAQNTLVLAHPDQQELSDGSSDYATGLENQASADRACSEGEVKELCAIPNQQGDCALGVIRCVQGQWSPCLPRFREIVERCGTQPNDVLGPATGDEDCDGLVDELAPHPPINCEMYMIDADNDGYGAIGPSYAQDPKNATYGCFCRDSGVPLDLAVPSNGRHNLDCGDCPGIEDSKLVHPGATNYYEKGSDCLDNLNWKGGKFDYNCNQQAERKHLGVHGCSFDENGSCNYAGSGFWRGETPACGENGFQNSCMSWPQTLEGHQDFCFIRSWSHPMPQLCR